MSPGKYIRAVRARSHQPGSAASLIAPPAHPRARCARLTHADVMARQRTVGNRAVGRMLARAASSSGGSGSRVEGLRKTLTWSDFKMSPPKGEPGNAFTYATANVTFSGGPANTPTEAAFESDGDGYRLKNEVVSKVSMRSGRSWKRLDGLSERQRQLVLDHEQVHYDITALFARDMFIELMGLKQRRFDSAYHGKNAADAIMKKYERLAADVSALYDDPMETGHLAFYDDNKTNEQERWERLIAKAKVRTEEPDEAPLLVNLYKNRLIDVIRAAGYAWKFPPD